MKKKARRRMVVVRRKNLERERDGDILRGRGRKEREERRRIQLLRSSKTSTWKNGARFLAGVLFFAQRVR